MSTRQTLVFDADDTLWENNVVFERVIDDFLGWVRHPSLERGQIRHILDDIERANAGTHGYGTAAFLRNLHECFGKLAERPATDAERAEIDALAAQLVEHQIELIPSVAATLQTLGARHDLYLLTKGDHEEQQRKIDASGLAPHFRGIDIVAEKRTDTYLELTRHYGWPVEQTWMIGNSPKSDVLPARAAGLRAVFVPNPHTWILEHDELDPDDAGVLQLKAFGELVEHF